MRQLFFLSVCLSFIIGCKTAHGVVQYRSIQALNEDQTVNMVVEIPTGSTAKYELNKETYTLEMDSINGEARFIDYLGYPGNYGFIPNTILPVDQGGDGDPLDILLLGPSLPRGTVVAVEIIGVLELLDNGEQDDKIIAILPTSNWSVAKDIDELDMHYPGVKEIIALFFEHYKGKDQMKIKSWSNKKKAWELIQKSVL